MSREPGHKPVHPSTEIRESIGLMDAGDLLRGYQSMTTLWHGYTDQQVIGIWDQHDWRPRLAQSLIEVAECRHYAAEYRLRALQVLNTAILQGILEEDWQIPERCARVMLAITGGQTRKRWHALFWRDDSKDRVDAAIWFLSTAANFVPGENTMSSGMGGGLSGVLVS